MGFTFNNRELVVNVSVDEVKEITGVESTPPSGKCPVRNFYVDLSTGRLVVEYDDEPQT